MITNDSHGAEFFASFCFQVMQDIRDRSMFMCEICVSVNEQPFVE